MNYGPSSQSMDRHPHSMDRFHFSILHQSHFRPMCRPSILWASILFYVPLFSSMCHYLVLWTIVPVYGPSSQSMDRHPHSMCRFYFLILHQSHFRPMCLHSILWVSILFYVPLFRSMCLHSILWVSILFYVPLSCSMCPRSALCAIAQFYGPTSTFYVPTERRSLYQSSFGLHHPGLALPINPHLSFNSVNISLAVSSPCLMQSGMPTPSNELPARWTPGKSSAKCLSTACNLST